MTETEWREAYPEIYQGFDARAWALDRWPASHESNWPGDPPYKGFFWRANWHLIPQEVFAELDRDPISPEQSKDYPTWTDAMAALVRAAREAYKKGWRP